MGTFAVVHGGWHGAWACYEVVPRLESESHEVVALDLPAHGTDTTPVGTVTMDDRVLRVGPVAESQSEPVVLVGHSSGGPTISQTAEEYTEHVDAIEG